MSDLLSSNYQQVTDRVTAKIKGVIYDRFLRVSIRRDLQEIAGVFELHLQDTARLRRALQIWLDDDPGQQMPIDCGQAIELAIDGQTVLIGTIEGLDLNWEGDKIDCHIAGRDRTGRLVECTALPDGPAEFRNVDLLYVAKAVCAPYGIPVRADVDIGAPFERLALHPQETALAFLEKATRQRAVLLTSDGVGGLLLTRGGKTRAPAPLTIGDNIQGLRLRRNWARRFSRYIVKGQSAIPRSGTAALDATIEPVDGDAGSTAPGSASQQQAQSVLMTGEARDPEVTEYRPSVTVVRTQSGMSTVQEQAEWRLRVSKGQSERLRTFAEDWRAGPDRKLWLPNQVTLVSDPYSGINKDMLIAGTEYRFDDKGLRTEISLAGVSAFDRIDEPPPRRWRDRKAASAAKLDATVVPLTAD